MSKTVVNFIAKFILLVIAQAVIFNNILLFNVAIAFVFVYVIVSMPITWSTNASVATGFLLGLCIDIFSDTQGMNSLCCTILSFVRKPVFHLYEQPDEDLGGQKPCLRTMGTAPFLKFLITMCLIYCFCFFLIEAFAVFSITVFITRVVCSTLFTFIVIYAIDTISTRKNEKRL